MEVTSLKQRVRRTGSDIMSDNHGKWVEDEGEEEEEED